MVCRAAGCCLGLLVLAAFLGPPLVLHAQGPGGPGGAPTSPAPAPASGAASGPAQVRVFLHVINVGRFDIATGTYTVDFYLNLVYPPGVEPDFEFTNGRAASRELIGEKRRDPRTGLWDVTWRIQANLASPVDLRRYPFDRQRLQLIIEDKNDQNTIDRLVYVPAGQNLDEAVEFTGWRLEKIHAASVQHHYPLWEQQFSQYVLTLDISRVRINGFIKTFLPVFFIVLVVMCSYIMGPDKVGTRLAMAGSGLTASVMFHVSIANSLPPLGYLTFADKFMILTYLFMLLTFIVNAIIMYAQERKHQDLVKRISPFTSLSVIVVVPVAYVLLFVLLL